MSSFDEMGRRGLGRLYWFEMKLDDGLAGKVTVV